MRMWVAAKGFGSVFISRSILDGSQVGFCVCTCELLQRVLAWGLLPRLNAAIMLRQMAAACEQGENSKMHLGCVGRDVAGRLFLARLLNGHVEFLTNSAKRCRFLCDACCVRQSYLAIANEIIDVWMPSVGKRESVQSTVPPVWESK
jgi:hypothetical protein